MFLGTYHNSIDNKGRSMIPAKLRHGFGDECIVILGPDKNIRVYQEEEYNRFLKEHILNRPMEDKNARVLQDFYTANAHSCPIDRQGRVNLPQHFIEYAGIQKDTVTVGNADYISIWSKEKYEAERSPQVVDTDALFSEMLKYVNDK
ncbi:MAG: division/cell wall cluster transcriptional repressor MraZ [Clostridiales Family XIII bacterium]|nr:division/cell wall cluster transcriptional repressor MraZ [Clostridiales Family XIII bacterium]